jgi:hypothetical protein
VTPVEILAALAWIVTAFAQPAQADSLTIAYTVSQNQTAVVAPGFTVVDFTGSVTNNSSSPITFQLAAVLHNFEPYVALFGDGIPFPGITLAPGASTGIIDLAMVTLQPFDPTLTYPGQCRNSGRSRQFNVGIDFHGKRCLDTRGYSRAGTIRNDAVAFCFR